MGYITKNCEECNKEFQCDTRESNRGNGKLCSLTCVAIRSNKVRKTYQHKCTVCKREYTSKAIHTKYCSSACKSKSYRLKKKANNNYGSLLNKEISKYPCEICKWNLTSRDVHHIIPVSKNGKDEINNLISLCPNHHRMVHRNFFSKDYLLKIVKSRTISSSLQILINKINKEQDAVSPKD